MRHRLNRDRTQQPATFLYTARDQRYWADIASIADRVCRPELDWSLANAQRSSTFDLLLGACVLNVRIYTNNFRERIVSRELGPYSLLFGLLIHSHPSVYFLPFNRSVWRLPEQPNFLGAERISKKDQLYLTEEAVIADTTPEELELIMQGGRIRKEAREKEGRVS